MKTKSLGAYQAKGLVRDHALDVIVCQKYARWIEVFVEVLTAKSGNILDVQWSAQWAPVILCSNLNKLVLGCFNPSTFSCVIKIKMFGVTEPKFWLKQKH